MNIIQKIYSLRGTNAFYFLVAIASASLYGTVGYYGTKIINADIQIYNMLFWRFWVSSIGLIIIVYFTATVKIKLNLNFVKQVFISAVFYALSTACCFHASNEIGIGLSMSIFFIFPIFNVVFSWFSDTDSLSKTIIYSLLLSFLGLYFIGYSLDLNSNNFKGVGFAILAAFSFSLYIFFTKKCVKTKNAIGSTFAIFLGNSIVFLFLSLKNNYFSVPDDVYIWKNIIILSGLSTILPTILMIYALAKISSTKIAITSIFEPVCALLIGSLFLSEDISNKQIIGIFVIIASNLIIQTDKSPQNI